MGDWNRRYEDERYRRWSEDRDRGGYGWEQRGGHGREDYGRDHRGGPFRERFEDRGYAQGHGGEPYRQEVYRGGGSWGGDYGGYSQHHGGSGREARRDPGDQGPGDQGYVGFGPDQGFWRGDRDERHGGSYGEREHGRSYGGGRGAGADFGYAYGPGLGGGYGYRSGRRGGQDYGPSSSRGRDQERGWWDRAGDEVSSWFGDDDAERRREMDARREGRHRGRGPRGYTRSDERIREDVSDRLGDDPMLDASDIEVSVSNGEVTLSGHVDSRWAKRRAEDIAEDVSGVTHVQNNLRVRASALSGATGQTTGVSGTTASTTAGASGAGTASPTGTGARALAHLTRPRAREGRPDTGRPFLVLRPAGSARSARR